MRAQVSHCHVLVDKSNIGALVAVPNKGNQVLMMNSQQ